MKSHTKNSETITYDDAIEIIRNSSYGIQLKKTEIDNGNLKETGGCEKQYPSSMLKFLQGETVYVKTTEEKLEVQKESLLYKLIFQEFIDTSDYNKTTIRFQKLSYTTFCARKSWNVRRQTFLAYPSFPFGVLSFCLLIFQCLPN